MLTCGQGVYIHLRLGLFFAEGLHFSAFILILHLHIYIYIYILGECLALWASGSVPTAMLYMYTILGIEKECMHERFIIMTHAQYTGARR